MPVGNVTETIQDGGLGIIPASSSPLHVVLGTASAGTANTLYAFSNNLDITNTVGFGPGPEAAAFELASPNSGGTILFMPINASVAGVTSAFTATRVASSNGTVTIGAGTPFDAYSIVVLIVSTGTGQLVTGGNVTVSISLDGGLTFNPNALVPASGTFVLTNTGLTLAFSVSATTFDSGDKFTATCQAPFYGATDVNNACTALGNASQLWRFAHFVGYPTVGNSSANATSSATIAAAVQTNFSTFESNFRYARYIFEAPPSTDADLQSAFVAFADKRGRIVDGTDVVTSAISGRKYTRSHAWADSARWGGIRVSTSVGRVADGPLPGIVSMNRDERTAATKMFDSRFGVSLTYLGLPGFFSDVGKTMAPLGSDFVLFMNGQVMDQACSITRVALLQFLNTSIRVNPTGSGTVGQPGGPGTIVEQDARGIERFVEAQIRAQMTPDISDVSVKVNRTDNIISTGILRVQIRITPLAYAQSIAADIGFQNPALVLS